MVAMMAPSFPAMVAVSWALMHALNAILAQGLLVRFGHNLRPSPRLAEVDLPKTALAALVACAIGGMVLPGDIGYLASNLVIIAALPYFIAGLGLAHAAAAQRLADGLAGSALFWSGNNADLDGTGVGGGGHRRPMDGPARAPRRRRQQPQWQPADRQDRG